MKMILRGRKVVGGVAEGEAFVTKEPISFLGGINPNSGTIVEKGHEAEGQRITGKVFVFPQGKGSTSSTYIIYAMSKRKTAPAAIINVKADPIIAVGASIGSIPLVDLLDQNPLDVIATGDYVKINGDKGIVEIIKKERTDFLDC